MKKKKIIKTLSVLFLVLLALISGAKELYKPQENVVFASTSNDLNLSVKSYYLMDYNTGTTLVGFNETERLEVASMVKLMTTLLTMEKIEKGEWTLEDKLCVSEYAASMEGSQAFLDAGHEYKIDDLLKSVIVASANDSCVVLAENMSGSEQNFVNIMNEKAKELGMTNTLYANSTGLPATTQYSCAKDIAKILSEVFKHDIYHKYATIWMDKLVHDSGRETELVNTNRLIRYFPGCDSGKTGFTDEAGYCLSASAIKNGMRLVSVVMGAKTSADRFENSAKLLNYGFNNFENKKMVDSNTNFTETVKVKSVKNPVVYKSERDLFVLSKRGDNSKNIEVKVVIDQKIKGPIKKDQKLGTVYLIVDGVVVDECNAVSSEDYKKTSYFDCFKQALDNFRI
ncbi:MAG: D-alanyl-D-alanine carboxypeptidase [Clostridiales bacterium]|nr:D-alanyl-D-alanine carboxypeptidase [Candidatus Apopatousia equi]